MDSIALWLCCQPDIVLVIRQDCHHCSFQQLAKLLDNGGSRQHFLALRRIVKLALESFLDQYATTFMSWKMAPPIA